MKILNQNIVVLRPSQLPYAPYYLFSAWLTQFDFYWHLILAIYVFLDVALWSYTIDLEEQSILERRGVFSVDRTETLIYRIKSVDIREPLYLRIFGLANVLITASDPKKPNLRLFAQGKCIQLRKEIRSIVEPARKKQGVREHDLFRMR